MPEPTLSSPDTLAEFTPSYDRPVVAVELGADGQARAATAAMAMAAPPERIWPLLRAVEKFHERVPMIHRSTRIGSRVQLDLRFKIALFTAKFGFVAEVREEDNRMLELRSVSGEPRNVHIRYDLLPLDAGRASLVKTYASFDIASLGWLVKFFLRHHPEIQMGVFPGTALVLLDALRRAVNRLPPAATPPRP